MLELCTFSPFNTLDKSSQPYNFLRLNFLLFSLQVSLLTVMAEWGGGTDSAAVDAVVVAFCLMASSSLKLTVISVTDEEATPSAAVSDFAAGCSGDR